MELLSLGRSQAALALGPAGQSKLQGQPRLQRWGTDPGDLWEGCSWVPRWGELGAALFAESL